MHIGTVCVRTSRSESHQLSHDNHVKHLMSHLSTLVPVQLILAPREEMTASQLTPTAIIHELRDCSGLINILVPLVTIHKGRSRNRSRSSTTWQYWCIFST